MSGIFSFDNAKRLHEKLERDLTSFCAAPSEDGLLNVLFPLYHLREWIRPGGHKSYERKNLEELSLEEALHSYLHTFRPYSVVRDLCNCAKHYNAEALTDRTATLKGLRVGYGRAGDRLGVTHFIVDGNEIRDIFQNVAEVYREYFRGLAE